MTQFLPIIVGRNFRPAEAREVFDTLQEHEVVTLVRDPDNQYDMWALQVHARGQFIGFVGKDWAAQMSPIIDKDPDYIAEGHEPSIEAKVFSVLDPKRPQLLVEITTGFELETTVNDPDEDEDEDEDDYPEDFSEEQAGED